ncbi:uncharacterized protein LOC119450654 [Dermacentor silvarum]|uniref:uncharacterized protein LOC119450654 n=1 Tax=Dermacentor silvarum TaxID=543639 RepID=UPI0018974C5C|nr:uncharacterized protein LOC119450654 [Dermacentor silvarum]
MVPVVIIVSLLLAFAGRSASQEQDCSKTVECYEKLRKEIVRNVEALPGPEPTSAKLASYKRFCDLVAPSSSPCSTFEDFKECLKRPEMEAREKVYNELRGFVCASDNATWTRFMGILFSKTNDSCKGAMDATKQVLKGDLDKCGMVEQLFDECATQRHLPTEVLKPGMELLGCRQEQPIIPTTPPAPHPSAGHGEQQQCDKDDAIRCLRMSAQRLETAMVLKYSIPAIEENGCIPMQASCLAPDRFQGCSDSDSRQLPALSVLEAAIEAVRSAACGNDRALLKNIRRTVSCLNVEKFKRCVDESRIDIGKTVFTEQECSASFSSVNKCIEKSRKLCEPDVDSARKLSSAFFSVYGCHPKQHQPKHQGPNSGASLASSVALTLSIALVASIAIRR